MSSEIRKIFNEELVWVQLPKKAGWGGNVALY